MAKTTPLSQVNTTFSGKNIQTVFSVYQYTVTTTGFHHIALTATVVGNGVYTIYLTRQWLGNGDIFTIEPKTLISVASGELKVEFQSMPVKLVATDIVQVMMLGLTGDSSVGGNISIDVDNFSVFDPAADAVATVSAVTGLTATNLDTTVSSRSTYAGGDTTGTTTLLTRLPQILKMILVGSDYYAAADLKSIMGTLISGTAAHIASAFTKWFDVTSPTGSVNSLPDALPGATGGVPTTDGTKVNQTVVLDLTQSDVHFGQIIIAKNLEDDPALIIQNSNGGGAVGLNSPNGGAALYLYSSNGGTISIDSDSANEAIEINNNPLLGADGLPLISTNDQDLSGSLHVDAKKLGEATPNNLAAGAAMTLTSAYDAAKSAASQTSVTAIATILTGITSLAKWLRGIFRSDTMDTTAKSEVNLGGGAYDESLDSLEALASKTSGLTAQQTRDAMKLAPTAGASAEDSIDDKLDDIPTTTPLTSQNVRDAMTLAPTAGTPATGSIDDQLAEIEGETDGIATIPEDTWAYPVRTITTALPGAVVIPPVAGPNLTIAKYATYSATITGLTIPSNWKAVYMTAKAHKGDADAASLLQIAVSNPPDVDDGLIYIMGGPPDVVELDNSAASLVVNQSAGTVLVTISDGAASVLESGAYSYDFKVILPDGSRFLTGEAQATVNEAQTRALE